MPEQLILFDGATFFYSAPNGDIAASKPEGFFYEDVRHLSRWCLTVTKAARPAHQPGRRLLLGPDRARGRGGADAVRHPRPIRDRGRARGPGREAHKHGTVRRGRYSVEAGTRTVTLTQDREGYRRGTVIRFRRAGRLRRDRVVFDLRLGPDESWKTCIDVIPAVDGSRRKPMLACGSFGKHAPKMPIGLDRWFETAPELVADWDPARHIYRQSLLDLAALRIRPREEHLRWTMPAGGLPWFMTVFGRDSIIAAYETLPFQAELARRRCRRWPSCRRRSGTTSPMASPGRSCTRSAAARWPRRAASRAPTTAATTRLRSS